MSFSDFIFGDKVKEEETTGKYIRKNFGEYVRTCIFFEVLYFTLIWLHYNYVGKYLDLHGLKFLSKILLYIITTFICPSLYIVKYLVEILPAEMVKNIPIGLQYVHTQGSIIKFIIGIGLANILLYLLIGTFLNKFFKKGHRIFSIFAWVMKILSFVCVGLLLLILFSLLYLMGLICSASEEERKRRENRWI